MLLRRIARPLLASWFVSEGLDAARRPTAHVAFARPAVDELLARTSSVPRTIVQVHGAATAAAGLALAFGKAPRTAALLLAALTLPVAAASMPGRKSAGTPTEVRRARWERFVRSLAFAGAALLAGADNEGRPGVSWRLADARDRASARASDLASAAAEHAKAVVSPR